MPRKPEGHPDAPTLQEFRYVGEEPRVFPNVQLPNRSTLRGEPGRTYYLDASTSHPLLVRVNTTTEPEPTPAADESAAS